MFLLLCFDILTMSFFIFMAVLACMLFSSTYGTSQASCIPKERQALLKFKDGLIDKRSSLASWNSSKGENCCKWRGVKCNDQTGHVVKLDLSCEGMSGKIGPSLLELKYLNYLDLSDNNFSGGFPYQLRNLTKLQYLAIGNAYGMMTTDNLEWLPYLTSLTYLGMYNMNFSSATPWLQSIKLHPSLSTLVITDSEFQEIDPLILSHINPSKSLTVLDLHYNTFHPSTFHSLFNLSSKLVNLTLFGCSFPGLLLPDSFESMTSLQNIDFYFNELEGGIPKSWGKLCNLTTLDLRYNNLSGKLPDLLKNLTGCANNSLEILYLNDNQLSGSFPDITIFSSLRELYLDRNILNGSFPPSFGFASKLEVLRLENNQLSGQYFLDFSKFLHLRELYVSNNSLTGTLSSESTGQVSSDDFISKLHILDLKDNQLTGLSLDFSKFLHLKVLAVANNNLSGCLSESIGKLSSLEILDASSNSMSGVLSDVHFSELSKLIYLDLSFNSLALNFSSGWIPPFQLNTIQLRACLLGPHFPSWIRTQTNYARLDISNSLISDVIPHWFWNLSNKLCYLNLSHNQISGMVPNKPFTFGIKPIIDLSSNQLYGPIPLFFTQAVLLNLSKNRFSGSMSFICSAIDKSITYLDLSHNFLSEKIPDCWSSWDAMSIMNLENNNFSDIIPSSMGYLGSIKSLRLRNNSLSGEVPSSLNNCSMLKVLDIGENKLSGDLSSWIGGSLTRLMVLRLRSNEFNGHIPSYLCHLRSLQILDLSLNNISGDIPSCISNLTAMSQKGSLNQHISYTYEYSYFYVNGYGHDFYGYFATPFGGYVEYALTVWKGVEQEYGKTLGLLKIINLSSNKLTGEIPREVTSLLDLKALDLSQNHLTGLIPKEIGQLTELEALVLSNNRLSGEIPRSLVNIYSLCYLNLSNNQLSGKIPSSTQLQSFNTSSYMGNPQLCGLPLSKKCKDDERTEDTKSIKHVIEDDGNWFDMTWLYIGLGSGFVTGFYGFCGILIFKKSLRFAYFKLLDNIGDYICLKIILMVARLKTRLRM